MIVAVLAASPREIAVTTHPGERLVIGEEGFQRDRGRDLPLVDNVPDRLVDPAVHRDEEMLRLKDLLDVIQDVVLHQKGAQQRLLGLFVVGQAAVIGFVVALEIGDADLCHRYRGGN